ncbi:MAG: proline dehydrogenase [Gemmatimonadales bacterium]|nr:MAG: proline dehydrogenase [Gemmatimonadales bacterium]
MLRRGLLFLSDSKGARKVLTGTPLTRSASQRFVPGETVDDVVRAAHEARELGLTITGNYLGEAVQNEADARKAADTYIELVRRIEAESLPANCSLKFTQMGQDISEAFLAENLGRLLEVADKAGVFLRFDMEGSDYTQRTLDAFERLWADGWTNTGVVLQAYLKRTPGDVRRMIELGARVRLCKGAYAEPPAVAHQDMAQIRESFIESMKWLISEGNYPGIATHDEVILDAACEFVQREGIGSDRFEFQMLYGVRRDLQRQLVDDGYNMRVYVPFGEKWYPYLMRRLAERPDNLMFMMGSVIKESPFGFLWPDGRSNDGRPR